LGRGEYAAHIAARLRVELDERVGGGGVDESWRVAKHLKHPYFDSAVLKYGRPLLIRSAA